MRHVSTPTWFRKMPILKGAFELNEQIGWPRIITRPTISDRKVADEIAEQGQFESQFIGSGNFRTEITPGSAELLAASKKRKNLGALFQGVDLR